MFGQYHYFRIIVSGQTYDIKLKPENQAYKICKELEREQGLALSWEKIALTFWGGDENPDLIMMPKRERVAKDRDKGDSKTNLE